MNNYRHFLLSGFRAMPPRDILETHRASTPLELLFDLVSVIAIAAAAGALHNTISHGHIAQGVAHYALAFFAIWWAWMNYTWFASAYDNDDTLFRLLTMLIMAGALTLADGIRPFFNSDDLTLIVIGFVIMRIGMVAFWLRAAKHHPQLKKTTLVYATGIALAQLYWVGLMLSQPLPERLLIGLYVLGIGMELAIPAIAEQFGATPWHRHHMIERYGLFNIIVLGETLLAGSRAIAEMGNGFSFELLRLTVASLVILFGLWWLYFSKEEHIRERRLSLAFVWGYGHLLIYIAGAAAGAGFAVMTDIVTHHAETSHLAGHYAVTIPVGTYLLGLWWVRDRFIFEGASKYILPAFALLILIAGHLFTLEAVALLIMLCVPIRNRQACIVSQ